MSAGAIGGVGAAGTTVGGGVGSLSSDEFIKIMLSELSNQDPFEPQDSAALLEQLSSIRNIESQLSLEEKLEALVLQNQITSAGSLIGRVVEGIDAGNVHVEGQVTAVRVEAGEVFLELDSGAKLAATRVTQIADDGTGSASVIEPGDDEETEEVAG